MALMVVPAVESILPQDPLDTARLPSRAQPDNHDRAERGVLMPPAEMQSFEIRNRMPPAPEPRPVAAEEEHSVSTSDVLTPASTVDGKQDQVYDWVAQAQAVWQRIASFMRDPISHSDTEELDSFNKEHGYNRLIHEKVDPYPQGYPQLAAFMYLDEDCGNARSFGLLSTRLILQLQVELTELEKELHELDRADAANPTQRHRLWGSEHYKGWTTAQQELLTKIRLKYNDYADLVIKQSSLRSLGKTTPRNHLQHLNWIMNKKPLHPGKDDFIFHADDFVSLASLPKKDRFFENLIEWWIEKKPHSYWLKRFLRTQTERDRTADENVDIYSPFRLSLLANILKVSFAVGSLLIPIFLLFLVRMSRGWMATAALVFVLMFTVMMLAITGARLQDVLYGTASFGAVLVAILGNVNQGVGQVNESKP